MGRGRGGFSLHLCPALLGGDQETMCDDGKKKTKTDVYQKGATEFHRQLAPEPSDVIISDNELQKAKSLLLPLLSFQCNMTLRTYLIFLYFSKNIG